MIISTLFSFLGGSAFRMLWGEISSYFNKQQDHQHEVVLLKLQGDLDKENHQRNIETIRLHSDLGIKEIQVKGETNISELETDAWVEAVKGTTRTIGVMFIDAWNGVIRPFVATWSVVMITIHYANNGWILDENGWMVCSAALGIYLADRALFKRGK
jgi:hypothetical protein